VDRFFGYDFFISYRWEDGHTYALRLAAELKRRGFDCFLDSESYAKGENWKTAGAAAIRRTSRLVLVGSPCVLKSEPVLREVRIFSKSGRRIIPIDFDDTLDSAVAAHHPLAEFLGADVLQIDEDIEQLALGPSEAALQDLQRAFDSARQSLKRMRALQAVAGTLAVMVFAIAGMWRQAVVARYEAERQSHRAAARELTLQSEKCLPRNPQLSLGLAGEAATQSLAADGSLPGDIERLLGRTIRATPRLLRGPGAQAVAWSPDGTKLVGGSQDNKARVWDLQTQRELGELVGHTDWLEYVAWSPDGRRIATASRDGTARLWDAADYHEIEKLPFGKTDVQTVSFHPRQHLLAAAHTAGLDNSPMMVSVWDYDEHRERFHVPGFRAAFSPDGGKLAATDGAGWGVIQLFDLEGRLLTTLEGHSRYVHALAWSPDGTRLASASVDDTVRVWDTQRGSILRVLDNKFALGVAWSPDGRYLSSGGGERTVIIWDATTLNESGSLTAVKTLTGEETRTGAADYIESLAWSQDGAWLAVADRGGWFDKSENVSVRIYSTRLFTARSAVDLLAVAQQHLQRHLSLEELRAAVEKCDSEH